jgi:hypothetical protein
MSYRIVNTDNFGGDYPNESFTKHRAFKTKSAAQKKADEMNAETPNWAPRYYKVVELPYTLQPGFEP